VKRKDSLVVEGVVGKVVSTVRCGSGDSRAVAATVLTSLAVVEINKATIGAYPDAIPGQIGLLWGQEMQSRGKRPPAPYLLSVHLRIIEHEL
jgi:hypothetical protein